MLYCAGDPKYLTISIKLLAVLVIDTKKRVTIPTTIFNTIGTTRIINVKMDFVDKILASNIFTITLTIALVIVFLIVAFDADFYGIIVKIPFNIDNCCCNCAVYGVQLDGFSRKLIKSEKNCFLCCCAYYVHRIHTKHNLILIVINKMDKNK